MSHWDETRTNEFRMEVRDVACAQIGFAFETLSRRHE